MRNENDLPRPGPRARRPTRPGSNRRRIIVASVIGALFVLLISLRGIAGFYTNYLWFDSLGRSGTWRTVLFTKVGLVVSFTLIFFALLWVNLFIADRLKPAVPPAGPEQEAVGRFMLGIGNRLGLLRIGLAGVIALIAGMGTAGQWNSWLLFSHAMSFGTKDAQFNTDVGVYVFRLPFIEFLIGWFFASLVIVIIFTAAAHYLSGGIRFQVQRQRVLPAVKAHLSVLLALLAVLKLIGYWVQRYSLTLSQRGYVDGATYTDVHAQLRAITLLMFISALAAILLLVNIWRRGWVFPTIAVGLWALMAVVVGGVYPALVQKFSVEPSQSTKEAPYIARNIKATRDALGIEVVDSKAFPYSAQLTRTQIDSNSSTIANARLLDPNIVVDAFKNLQGVNAAYTFNDLDIDRYKIGNKTMQVVLGARELNIDQVPQQSWEGTHLAYTHGYGMVLAPANAVTPDGRPDFTLRDLPPVSIPDLKVDQNAIYFGEKLGGYSIVNTTRAEVDFVKQDGTTQTTAYSGSGGVKLSSFLRRAAYALHFGDLNPLISNYVDDTSRILYVRDVRDRVAKLAPFLKLDADPYPVITNGRVLWVLDAYTTSNRYPNAQRADHSGLATGSGLNTSFNYVRNSVKAVIDSYDGSVKLYIVDPSDPIVNVYASAFPDLFSPASEISTDLKAHFRYPEDLFRVQTNMWGRYHIDDPKGFYDSTDRWSVAQDPGTDVTASTTVDTSSATTNNSGADTATGTARSKRIDPYYQLMKLPDSTGEAFVLFRPFVPYSDNDTKKNLTAFMVADSDPSSYGRLRVFTMPRGTSIDGPAIVAANIKSQPDISSALSLLEGKGSTVKQGNLLLLPVDNSLLYIRPLYVQSDDKTAVPELKKVIVTYAGASYLGDTLNDALNKAFGVTGSDTTTTTTTTTPNTSTTTPGTPSTDTVQSLLKEASDAFAAADKALTTQDFATYGEQIAKAKTAIEKARKLAAGVSA